MSGYQHKKRMAMALRRYITNEAPCDKHRLDFGCSAGFLRAFLEFQFVDGMSWLTFGTSWHVGHVLALRYFDHEDRRERAMAWHFVNLRPIEPRTPEYPAAWALRVLEWRAKYFKFDHLLLQRAVAEAKGHSMYPWESFRHPEHRSMEE